MNLSVPAQVGVGVGLAALLAFVTTPVAIRAAQRFAFYDLPRGYKGHGRPTPYLGGTAVILAFTIATLASAGDLGHSVPLLAAGAVLLVVGTVDDRRTVPPGVRVVIEFALGTVLAALGVGWHLGSSEILSCVVTGVWVVGVVNAFNLFDNMDGASSTMALVSAAGICALGLVTGNEWVAAGSAALCGACLGFLPHNMSSPAKIFLGDGGSMPLGFAVAVLAANAARHAEPGILSVLVGFLLVGIPALDTTLVIVSRTRRGISVLTGGRDHLTHRTRIRMKTPRRVALVLGGAQALLSSVVILGSRAGSPGLVYVLLAFVVLGVAAIVALEDALPIEARAADGERRRALRASQPAWQRHFPALVLAVLGLGAGLSALFSAYYSPGTWVPIGFVLVIAAALGTIARPPRITLPVALVTVGLAGLGLWSLLSISWAQAGEQASANANLWLSYAAFFLLTVIVLRGAWHTKLLLVAVGVGIAAVAISVLVRLLGSDPNALFISGRLNSPLGYINGEGCVFAMGIWLGLGLAEQRRPLLAGLGAAIGVVMAGMGLLSESRGAAIATGVAILVCLLAIPGRRRRVFVLAITAGGLAAAASPILHVYSVGKHGIVTPAAAHAAVLAIVLAAAAAGVVWGALVAAGRLASDRGGGARTALDRATTVLAVVLVLIPLAAAAIRAPQLESSARTQWNTFVHLKGGGGNTAGANSQVRLFTGAGHRYDYWRVAWHVFLQHPVLGVGAGNYPASYFSDRRTEETIRNPHSIELQMLSELGLPGGLLLITLVVGVVLGARRLRRVARGSVAARGLMVGAGGAAVVWFVDTSGDWMHLLPGVTAVGLAAMAVLCASSERDGRLEGTAPAARIPGRHRLPVLLAAAGVIFVLAVGGANLLRSGLSQRYLNDGQAALHGNPARAIDEADRALDLDGANLDAYYVKAAGQARFDQAAEARATLLQATQEDPSAFITWTLLGDLEVRLGHVRAARGYYRRALALDPREPSLRQLVSEPTRRLLASAR